MSLQLNYLSLKFNLRYAFILTTLICSLVLVLPNRQSPLPSVLLQTKEELMNQPHVRKYTSPAEESIHAQSLHQISSPYSPTQQCRLDIEKWLNPMIDEFLQLGNEMPPIIDWVWDMGTYFLVNLKYHPILQWNYDTFVGATWNWQDQFGTNYTGGRSIQEKAQSGQQKKFKERKLIHLTHHSSPPHNPKLYEKRPIPIFLWASNMTVPLNRTVRHWVYDLRPFLRCDQLEMVEETPPQGTKIGMCVRFRDNHHLVAPFIAYHQQIGVQHFWFYLNEEFNIDDLPVSDHVTYIPYRYVWHEHRPFSQITQDDGTVQNWNLPRDGHDFWQEDSQLQCLYRAKRYNLDWIMTNDIDEYLWVNKIEERHEDVSNTRKPTNSTRSILQEFLQEYETIPDLGALKLQSWAFGRHGSAKFDLAIDYTYHATRPSMERSKLIYRVPVATNIGIHYLVAGGKAIALPPSDARWNHYRRPYSGIFQLGNVQPIRDTRLPDKYRQSILEWIRAHPPPKTQRNGTTFNAT